MTGRTGNFSNHHMDKTLILIVIYKARLEECRAFRSLSENRAAITAPHEVVAYNNSPEVAQEGDACRVVAGRGNDMLAKAYNAGLAIAREEGCGWLLLMDQDTEFTAEYFREASRFVADPDGCDAAVPSIVAGGKVASPTRYNPAVGPYLVARPVLKPGRCEGFVTAFNSGAILRVSALEGLGGFNEEYPLDALDNWYFHHLCKAGHPILLLDCVLRQDLSLCNPESISPARYKSVMNSAIRFAKSIGPLALLGWKARAAARCIVQLLSHRKRKLLPLTFKYLFVNELK